MIEEINRRLINFLRDEVDFTVIQGANADVLKVEEDQLPALILIGPDVIPNMKEMYALNEPDGPIVNGKRFVRKPDMVVDLRFDLYVALKFQGGESGYDQCVERLVRVLHENKQLMHDGVAYDMDGFSNPITYQAARDGLGNRVAVGEIRITSVVLKSTKRWLKPLLDPSGPQISYKRKEVE